MKKIISILAVSLKNDKITFQQLRKEHHRLPMTDKQIAIAQREYDAELAMIGFRAILKLRDV
jgi:hypothetical protein